VRIRGRYLWALGFGLWSTSTSLAQEPPRLGLDDAKTPLCQPVSTNQQMANTIVSHLRQSGHLKGYRIDVRYYNGAAEVTGTVADQPQREEALRIVQGVPGVERVFDRLTVIAPIQRTQGTEPPPISTGPVLGAPADPPMTGPGTGSPMLPTPGGATQPGTQPGGLPEPMPLFQAQPGAPNALNPPVMPPYAWPSFAPYNNYSRVATPLAYPANAFPYIGPVYPFPKVPLGWRSVKLEWEDGHWWFSKVACKHDWWRLRYW